jgi:hypothetical protein
LEQGVSSGEEWQFSVLILDKEENNVTNQFTFKLQEVQYDKNKLGYKLNTEIASIDIATNTAVFQISYTAEELKSKDIRLVISSDNIAFGEDYYIQYVQLFKRVKDNNGVLIEPASIDKSGVIKSKYWFVQQDEVKSATDAQTLHYDYVYEEDINFDAYKPIYNEGAIKRRAVSAKESNYFNILQSIAETFEAWLHLEIERDPSTGAITSKTAYFKNYSGGTNYANFRYGVNLKDI